MATAHQQKPCIYSVLSNSQNSIHLSSSNRIDEAFFNSILEHLQSGVTNRRLAFQHNFTSILAPDLDILPGANGVLI